MKWKHILCESASFYAGHYLKRNAHLGAHDGFYVVKSIKLKSRIFLRLGWAVRQKLKFEKIRPFFKSVQKKFPLAIKSFLNLTSWILAKIVKICQIDILPNNTWKSISHDKVQIKIKTTVQFKKWSVVEVLICMFKWKMKILEDSGNSWIHTEEIIKTPQILKTNTKERFCGKL